MSQWLERVEDLLYDGESVEERVDVGAGSVVVTSHRVLAFTPEAEGANVESVDRPNVEGVDRATEGEFGLVVRAVEALVLGGVLLAAGRTVNLDGLVGGIELTTTAGMGLGGFVRTMQSLLDVLAMLDELLTVAGALVLLAGAVLLGAYAWTRETRLVVGVAGDEDLELPLPGEEAAAVDRIERAVRPDGSSHSGESESPDEAREGDGRRVGDERSDADPLS